MLIHLSSIIIEYLIKNGMIHIDPSHKVIEQIDLTETPRGKISRYWLHITDDGLGLPVYLPVMVAHGFEEGPTLGVIAAVHGDELNGVPVIQRLFKEIEITELRGTLVGIPVMNIPGFLAKQRYFQDGTDLNRILPGKADGNVSEVYANRWVDKILTRFDYLIDLHTASFGRINSYYIRANMNDPVNAELALLQHGQIILNSPAPDSTVRGFVNENGGKAITLEVGDPNKFQKGMIRSGLTGIHNTLNYLNMTEGEIEYPNEEPVICQTSYWIYTEDGGILQVLPDVTAFVKKGEKIAILKNIFGDTLKEYFAPETGIVIGKSTHPVAPTGSRILHLGVF